MAVNPFVLARTLKVVQDAQQEIANMQTKDRAATREFVGKETEVVDDMMRDKELAVSKLLGKKASGVDTLNAIGDAAMFMNPLAGAIVKGFTTLLSGRKQRKHALKQIKKSIAEIQMPEKYAQSWLGKRTKAFEHGYETKLQEMKSSLPSSSDIFKSALLSGVGSYAMSGGKSEMNRLRAETAPTDAMGYSIDPTYGDMSLNVNPQMGIFTGGLDFKGGGLGKPLFGQGNLLDKLISGEEMTNREMAQLSPLMNLLNFNR